MSGDVVTHVVVSTFLLAVAVAAARWIRPLTARTRHAILIAGMAAFLLPAPLIARIVERQAIVMPQFTQAMNFAAPVALGSVRASVPQTPNVVVAIWLSVAAVLLLRWWLTTQRLVATAFRAATPPPPRAIRALDDVRARLGLRRSIDLLASPTCEAPAVVRVFRPVIILPADGCETLDDEELQSLLCHECAHVARHDNLLGVAEAVVCSLFWFNPLVWFAHRRIAAAREAACDERVADAALPAETYVGALAKICRSAVAPHIPAVSCMASAHLKERIQHLMSYATLRKSALSHRTVAVSAILTVILFVIAAGVVTAQPAVAKHGDGDDYQLNYSMNMTDAGMLAVRVRIVDTKTGAVAGEPSVTTRLGEKAQMRFGREENGVLWDWYVEVDPSSSGGGNILLRITRDGVLMQETVTAFPPPGPAPTRSYSGAPINLNLHKADIRDVLKTFGQLTGLEVTLAPEVQGIVNVKVTNTPWDQALDDVVRDAGYTWRLEGGKLHVYKP